MSSWKVVGSSSDPDTYFCRYLVGRMVKAEEGSSIEFVNMLEVDFLEFIATMRLEKGGGYFTYKENFVVERNGEFLGDLMTLVNVANKEFGMEDAEIANTILFEKNAIEETQRLITERSHPSVTLTFKDAEGIGKEDPVEYGKITVELFDDYAPKAVKNFMGLCTGKNEKNVTYASCPVHRIVPGGWFQSGDIIDGSGKNSQAAVETGKDKFEDESFSIDFGAKYGGIVGYSSGEVHNNGSQFFVTLGPCEWMNNTQVGFGRVVSGFKTLAAISKVSTSNERPNMPLLIDTCEIFTEAKVQEATR